MFTRDTKQGLEATQPRYVGRPGISAFRAVRSRKLGFHVYPSPWLANVEQVSFISENAAGEIMEQEMVPVPSDWLALKQRLLDELGVSFARISSAGVVSVGYYGRTVQLLAAYEVDPNKAAANDNRNLVFVEAGDLNDDGEVDYYSYYPNGDRQVIFVFPADINNDISNNGEFLRQTKIVIDAVNNPIGRIDPENAFEAIQQV